MELRIPPPPQKKKPRYHPRESYCVLDIRDIGNRFLSTQTDLPTFHANNKYPISSNETTRAQSHSRSKIPDFFTAHSRRNRHLFHRACAVRNNCSRNKIFQCGNRKCLELSMRSSHVMQSVPLLCRHAGHSQAVFYICFQFDHVPLLSVLLQ